MKRLETRVRRLEGLTRPYDPKHQQPLPDLAEFAAKLDRMNAEWAAEAERRQKLSFEEQMEHLKADRDHALRVRAERKLGAKGEGTAMDAFATRLFEVLIAQLEQKIHDRDEAISSPRR